MIETILKGDQRAFKLLVDTYQLMVVNTCYAFVHDRDEAEDIAQDVFVQVFESLGKFRFESKLSTWLYRIAVTLIHGNNKRLHKPLKCPSNKYWKNKNK